MQAHPNQNLMTAFLVASPAAILWRGRAVISTEQREWTFHRIADDVALRAFDAGDDSVTTWCGTIFRAFEDGSILVVREATGEITPYPNIEAAVADQGEDPRTVRPDYADFGQPFTLN